MADVFLSYSAQHRHLTEQLARDLEAKGLSVWWDTDLIAGDDFRRRIQAELNAAKAAIVIWTPEAINSDYVLSEAERARLGKKLLQVRTDEVSPQDLPPPFDASHIPLIEDRRAIYGGLAKLGLLDASAATSGDQPTALYSGGSSAPNAALTWRQIAPVAALLAVVALIASAAALYQSSTETGSKPIDLADPKLRQRAVATTEALMASLNSGLQDTGLLAPELRLSRRGLMNKADAAAELRKTLAAHSAMACKAETASLTLKKAEQAPNGYRAIVPAFCDLTGPAGTTTEAFRLELEATDAGGRDQITGLWQPDKMVLWQPK